MENEVKLPESQDKLFLESNPELHQTVIVTTGMDKFFLFSEGYKTAATILAKQTEDCYFYANLTIYPLFFLNRQFLELRLKELIIGLNFILTQERSFPNGHDLKQLWDKYRNLVSELNDSNVPKPKLLNNVEKLIDEFNNIDPKSMSFRYPVDSSQDRKPSLGMTNIDLKNFMTTMDKLYNFFDNQSEMVFNLGELTREYISSMQSAYESEMRSYYNS
uniref:HEPN domain-containing protein n=1 Tax=Ignavibacterium album TaxID=591197 RepID=A0A832G055_9BACT